MESLKEFKTGETVIYPMLGKCTILGREEKSIGGKTLAFYKLEVQKSSFSRSQRQEPAVWIPINAAQDQGLRTPLLAENAPELFKIFASREYFFDLHRPWNLIQADLENATRREGAIGLAKAASALFVLKKKQIVPTPEVNRLSETIDRLLYRELSEATGESIRSLEERIAKMMRPKLTPDS
jgi:RNA polymerase-interacting CarD/CdnL/TRCF family regulator